MKYTTEARLKRLEQLMREMENGPLQREALHLLQSLRQDIEGNYAEIRLPIRPFDKYKD